MQLKIKNAKLKINSKGEVSPFLLCAFVPLCLSLCLRGWGNPAPTQSILLEFLQ